MAFDQKWKQKVVENSLKEEEQEGEKILLCHQRLKEKRDNLIDEKQNTCSFEQWGI